MGKMLELYLNPSLARIGPAHSDFRVIEKAGAR
jgi:hypothetical protein